MSAPRAQDIHCGQKLDAGETVVWSGRPDWKRLALRSFHTPIVGGYFILMTAYDSVAASGNGTLSLALTPLFAGVLAVALLCGFAVLVSRSTNYVITDRRVVFRFGVAFPRSLSIPFRQIVSMAVSVGARRRGDISLVLRAENHMPYLKLWPHARPWHLRRPEPMLCDIEAAGAVATTLARALSLADANARQPQIEHPLGVDAAAPIAA